MDGGDQERACRTEDGVCQVRSTDTMNFGGNRYRNNPGQECEPPIGKFRALLRVFLHYMASDLRRHGMICQGKVSSSFDVDIAGHEHSDGRHVKGYEKAFSYKPTKGRPSDAHLHRCVERETNPYRQIGKVG